MANKEKVVRGARAQTAQRRCDVLKVLSTRHYFPWD